MKVHCHTNLDLCHEVWPDDMPAVPRVGDRIQSATKHSNNFQLELEVVRVTWRQTHTTIERGGWTPSIELHMTSFQKNLLPPDGVRGEQGSIVAFYHWYAPLVSATASAFL